MNGTDDEQKSLRGILDGTNYLPRRFRQTESKGEEFSSQTTFVMQKSIQNYPTDEEKISAMKGKYSYMSRKKPV